MTKKNDKAQRTRVRVQPHSYNKIVHALDRIMASALAAEMTEKEARAWLLDFVRNHYFTVWREIGGHDGRNGERHVTHAQKATKGHDVSMHDVERAAKGAPVILKTIAGYNTPLDTKITADGDVPDGFTLTEALGYIGQVKR